MAPHLIALRSSAAALSCSLAICVKSRLSHHLSERIARRFSSVLSIGFFVGLSAVSSQAVAVGASTALGAGRAQQKGELFRLSADSTFDRIQLVIQRVISLDFFIEAPMQQTELPLLCRLDAPSVVPPSLIVQCESYRDAVRLCWQLRRVRNMTQARLAEDAGLYAPHVTCYLNESQRSRDLPGSAVRGFEWACGNTAISQWHALNAKLTCVEEMQAMKALIA